MRAGKYPRTAPGPLGVQLSGLLSCPCPFSPIPFSEPARLMLCFALGLGLFYSDMYLAYLSTTSQARPRRGMRSSQACAAADVARRHVRGIRDAQHNIMPLYGSQKRKQIAPRRWDGTTSVWAGVRSCFIPGGAAF
jgi:hypothetical protein